MGGKGSGRKKKNAVKTDTPAPPAARQVQPAAQKVTVQQPEGDPFRGIEADLNANLPKNPAPAAANQPAGPEQPAAKAPEKLIRWIWKGFYGLEDYLGRRSLGLGDEFKGIFFKPEIAEAHIEPTCQIAVKRLPAHWLEMMNKLEENSPEFILAGLFIEAQMDFQNKLEQIKKEVAAQKKNNPVNPQPAAQKNDGNMGYPKKNEVIS